MKGISINTTASRKANKGGQPVRSSMRLRITKEIVTSIPGPRPPDHQDTPLNLEPGMPETSHHKSYGDTGWWVQTHLEIEPEWIEWLDDSQNRKGFLNLQRGSWSSHPRFRGEQPQWGFLVPHPRWTKGPHLDHPWSACAAVHAVVALYQSHFSASLQILCL